MATLAYFKKYSDGLFLHLSDYNVTKSIKLTAIAVTCKQEWVLSKCHTVWWTFAGSYTMWVGKKMEWLRGENMNGIMLDRLGSQCYREIKQDIMFYKQNNQGDFHKG